jgi:predicted RNA binding protein YcfA (HicA-like mRNA interferase family)
MTSKELLKILKKEGWEKVRVTGSHYIMAKEEKRLPVPYHNKDLKKGTLHSIMKGAGLK